MFSLFMQILYSKDIPNERMFAEYRWNAVVMYLLLSSLSEHVMNKDDSDTVSKNIVCTLYSADLFVNTLKSMRQNRIRNRSTNEERAEATFAANNAVTEKYNSKMRGDLLYRSLASKSYEITA